MGSVPSFLDEDRLEEWIQRGETALRFHDLNPGWANAVGKLLWNDWIRGNTDSLSSRDYLQLIYDTREVVDGQDVVWWKLENMFWLFAVGHYGVSPPDVSEVLAMAQDFTIDEWGVPL